MHTTTGMHYTQSKNGYNAFTPSSGKAGFEEHKNAYCDDGGGNNGHKYAYHGDLSEEACAAKCTELKCTCYDYKNGAAPGPGPSPSKSASAQSVFPGFARAVGPSGGDMPCFSYHGVQPGMQACSSSTYKESHQGGAPLVLYDGANKRPAAHPPRRASPAPRILKRRDHIALSLKKNERKRRAAARHSLAIALTAATLPDAPRAAWASRSCSCSRSRVALLAACP